MIHSLILALCTWKTNLYFSPYHLPLDCYFILLICFKFEYFYRLGETKIMILKRETLQVS